MITASLVQIAVDLDNADDAQDVLDLACPGVFDVLSVDRTVWAYSMEPTVPAVAVAQGRVEQAEYALLATLALAGGVNHLAVGVWLAGDPETFQPADQGGTLWEAMQIQTVEEIV